MKEHDKRQDRWDNGFGAFFKTISAQRIVFMAAGKENYGK